MLTRKISPKRHILFLFAILCIAGITTVPGAVSAQFVITEILYDPAGADGGREWIEVYNESDVAYTVIGGTVTGSWRLVEVAAETTRSRTFSVETTPLVIPGRTYAVIAKNRTDFLADFPNYTGLLLVSSAMSLTNTNGKILFLTNGTDPVSDRNVPPYTPVPEANGTGASLQRQQDGTWIAGMPTPGAHNTTIPHVIKAEEGDTGDAARDDDFIDLTSTWPFRDGEVFVRAGKNMRVFVGQQISFKGNARFRNGDFVRDGRMYWAFGDGRGEQGMRAEHAYHHPGVYRALFRVMYGGRLYQDSFLVHVIATENIGLEVVNPERVDVVNTSNLELELSGWSVEGGGEKKRIAKGTFVRPNSRIPISFSIGSTSEVRLRDMRGNVVDRVSLSLPQKPAPATHTAPPAQTPAQTLTTNTSPTETLRMLNEMIERLSQRKRPLVNL
jgi:hypothetical protein